MLKTIIFAFFLASAVSIAHADPKDETSVRIFKVQMQLAQSGDAEGQYYVGEMYEKGLGTSQDLKLAHAWYTKSAAQGNALARDKLANWKRIQQEIASAKADTVRAKQLALEAAKVEQRAAEATRAKQQAEAKERAAAEARTREQALEKERATKEAKARAREQALEKERAAKEAKAPPPMTPTAAPAAPPAPPAAAAPPAPKAEETETKFSANPCKGPSARFMSTCK